jgi:hypothetical protein
MDRPPPLTVGPTLFGCCLQPWLKWGCPIDGCGQWFLGPWDLEWHTTAERPGWTAPYQLLRPYPNQRQRVVYRRL